MKNKFQGVSPIAAQEKFPQWWASRSIVNLIKKRPTKVFGIKHSQRRIRSSTIEKHTFFPGNEINRIRIVQSDRFLFSADSHLKALWDAIVICFTLIILFTIPYSLSYYEDLDLKEFYGFVNILFMVDILVQANTTFSDKGRIIVSRTEILKNYVMSWFVVDLAAGLPLELILPSMNFSDFKENSPTTITNPQRFLWLLKVFKALRMHSVLYKIKYIYAYQAIFSLTEFFTTLLIVSISVHWISCLHNILYVYGTLNGENLNTGWNDNKTKHLRFIERAVQTITSVGYGDTSIKTIPERMNASLMMIITSGLMGYFVGGIRSSISKSYENENYFRDIIMKFKKYAEIKKISPKLRSKVLNYYRHLKELSKNNVLDERELLNIISMPLRSQIGLHVRGYILTKVTLFTKYSKGCIKALGEKMRIFIYSPSDLIIKEGELTNTLYFIISGNVEIYHEFTRTVFSDLTEGNQFGEISFFTGEARKASARSRRYTEVLALHKHDFIKITNEMPKDKENGEVIIRNYKVYGLVILGIRCYLCKDIGHVAKDCPKYSAQIPLNKIIMKYHTRKNKVNCSNFIRPSRIEPKSELKNLNYSILNTKGKEANFSNMKVETNITRIIKRDYLHLYSKKRFSKYMSSSESSDEGIKNMNFDELLKNKKRKSRNSRSSTVFVENSSKYK